MLNFIHQETCRQLFLYFFFTTDRNTEIY